MQDGHGWGGTLHAAAQYQPKACAESNVPEGFYIRTF